MTTGPKVSILLAVHNGAEFIRAAIESVRAQEYRNWELVIVENGSTDATARICAEYAAVDPRVRVASIPQKNKNKAYNLAFDQAVGDYFCYLGGDDVLVPDSLRERLRPLVGESESAFSTCCLETMSEDPKYDGLVFPRNKLKPNYSGGSVLFSRSLAAEIFPLPVDQPNEDTWSQLHLRALGVNQHVPKALYRYRIHGRNSYGYGMKFPQKRAEYLRRMRAYELFYEKFKGSRLSLLDSEVIPFVRGLRAAETGSVSRVLLVRGLHLRNKLVLAFYCSPTMYRIRHMAFRAFSGGARW